MPSRERVWGTPLLSLTKHLGSVKRLQPISTKIRIIEWRSPCSDPVAFISKNQVTFDHVDRCRCEKQDRQSKEMFSSGGGPAIHMPVPWCSNVKSDHRILRLRRLCSVGERIGPGCSMPCCRWACAGVLSGRRKRVVSASGG